VNKICKQCKYSSINNSLTTQWDCKCIHITFDSRRIFFWHDPVSYIKYILADGKCTLLTIQTQIETKCPDYNKLKLLAKMEMI